MQDPDFKSLFTQRVRVKPKHSLTEDEINSIKDEYQHWELEDGFPCAHRRPRKFFVKEHVTWSALWKEYEIRQKAHNKRVVSYTRWIQYIHYYYPGLRLSRTAEDLCDACVRLNMLLKCDDLDATQRAAYEEEKKLPLDAAIGQRRTMSAFIHDLVNQQLTDKILPDCIDDETEIEDAELQPACAPTVLVQAEDFGGSLAMPHFGWQRTITVAT